MNDVARKERRLNQRFPYEHPIRYMAMGHLKRPPDEAPRIGGVVDLSNGGMRIRTAKPGLGKGVILRVWLPVSEVEVSVPVIAEVVWMEEQRPATFQAGLMFMV